MPSSIQFVSLRRIRTTGEIWDTEFRPGLNLLVGGANTSKTTALRILDFCLGHPLSAERRFPRAILDEYAEFQLRVLINGDDHLLTRRLHDPGQMTRVDVDGVRLDTMGFNEWVARALGWGWPPLQIPKGIYAPAITERVPLTFRTLYRHIYRRANSWTEWANNEEEYHRRAVLAFFLGIGAEVYGGGDVEITRAELRREELERVRAELRTLLNSVVARISQGYRMTGTTNLDTVEQTMAEVEGQIQEVEADRNALATTLRANPHYDRAQDERLAALHAQSAELARQESDLSQTLAEQHRLRATLDGDVTRVERARIATSALREILVTACPACHQPIPRRPEHTAEKGECYVCQQPISPDRRDERLQLEQRALKGEVGELDSVIGDIERELSELHESRVSTEAQRTALAQRLDRERQTLLTPLMSQLEASQRRIGQLEERRSALQRLSEMRSLLLDVEARQLVIEQQLDDLRATEAARVIDRGLITERGSELATRMNRFVSNLPPRAALGAPVTVNSSTLEVFVGRDVWNAGLGNERMIIFLLAYHYALLRLGREVASPFPCLAVLDNPFQQDLPEDLTAAGLAELAELCQGREDIQVLVATRRPLSDIVAHRIQYDTTFEPVAFGATDEEAG